MPHRTMGERIRQLRTDLDLSQQQVADRMDVRVATLSGWENDHATPNAGYLRLLADLAPTPGEMYDWLLHGGQKPAAELASVADALNSIPYSQGVPEDYDDFVRLLERVLQRSTMVSGLVAMMATDAEKFGRPRAAAYLRATREAVELTTTLMSHARGDLRLNGPIE